MSETSTQKSTQPDPAGFINREALVKGDIIATRAHTVNSKGVRFVTFGRVSHVILYTGEIKDMKFAVDAMPGNGVTEQQLREKLQPAAYAVVFRHRTATPEQCARACQWARLQAVLNKPYDYNSAARAGSSPLTNIGRLIIITDEVSARLSSDGEDDSFMCSELVFRAFEIAGAPLSKKQAHRISPGTVFHTERLECLGRLV